MNCKGVSVVLRVLRQNGILVLAAGLLQCGGGDSGSTCAVGTEGCPCTEGGACDPGLICLSDICVNREGQPTGEDGAAGGAGESSATGTGGGTAGGGGESPATGTGGGTAGGGGESPATGTGGSTAGGAGESSVTGTGGGTAGGAGESAAAGAGGDGPAGGAGESPAGGAGGGGTAGGAGESPAGGGGGGAAVGGAGGNEPGAAGEAGAGGSTSPAPEFDCSTYCAAAERACALDQAGVDACEIDCEMMSSTDCGETYWSTVIECGSEESAWSCDQGEARLTGCQLERTAYSLCMHSELCADACDAAVDKCSLDSSVRTACINDCLIRMNQIDNSYPECTGLAVAGWICAADPDAWSCNGTSSATRVGCTQEADELSACLTDGLDPTSTVTCGSYTPCCELCDTQCTGSSGTHLDSYKQCLYDCMFCCEPCNI